MKHCGTELSYTLLSVKFMNTSGCNEVVMRSMVSQIVVSDFGAYTMTKLFDLDEFVQQAHASEDPVVKITYRYHSETTTVKSQ